jgi:dTDP-4-amino-4,6-dideoxygalactose transaminase
MRIPFNRPYLTGNELPYIQAALESRLHCGNHTFGKRCAAFIEGLYGHKKVFLTPSCTAAMEMGAVLADLGPGDEVILPSWTFSSTANAIVLQGARPVFCEIDPATMNIDVKHIEALITPKTRMLAPIDYMGIPCDIDCIMQVARRHNLIVMEDAAQSTHSKYKGRWAGTTAHFSAHSFHETKNFTCGEGGALCLNDERFVARAELLQEKGTDRSLVLKGVKNKYTWVDKGSSYLLADMLAAQLLAQFERADEIVRLRGRVHEAYVELFTPFDTRGCLQIPKVPAHVTLNHHAFFVIFDTEEHQTQFLSRLREHDVSAYIGYLPLHSSEMGRRYGYTAGDLPITEAISKRIVRLPFYADMAHEGLDHCVSAMRTVLTGLYGQA